jgi:uncharacterized protein YvpB
MNRSRQSNNTVRTRRPLYYLVIFIVVLVAASVWYFSSPQMLKALARDEQKSPQSVTITATAVANAVVLASPANTVPATASIAPPVQLAVVSDINLNVPVHLQEHALSCEAAALTMALNYKGTNVTETQIISQVGFDTTPHVGPIWGNPQAAFVGNIDGTDMITGYGVYWGPIAKVGANYRPTQAFTNGTIQMLTSEIAKGNPVVVWYNTGSGRSVTWQTPNGQIIHAISGEHAVTVRGFVGPQNNPTKIIYNDPLRGEVTLSVGQFSAQWSLLGYAGVIVR